MYQKLPTRWIAVLLFLSAALSWNACSKEYSLEKDNGSVIGDLLPDDDSTNNNDNDSTGNDNDSTGNGDEDTTGNGGDDDPTVVGDAEFMKRATFINRAQIANAALTDRATAESVRDFGDALSLRFKEAMTDMEALSAATNVAIPAETDAAHQAVTKSLADLEGKTFDITFIDYQMEELQKAIDLYREQIANGDDQRVKAYAQKFLPYLEGLLQTASQIRQTL
jgi:putative membrane protein